MAGERTEKATPKRRADARKKGQVARSADLNGAAVLLAGLFALSAFAPAMAERLQEVLRRSLALVQAPEAVSPGRIGEVLGSAFGAAALACAPVVLACAAIGVLVNLAQVGLKPTPQAIKPQWGRLNPVSGLKNLFGVNALFETVKGIVKIGVVGAVSALALLPRLSTLAGLVGMDPGALLGELARTVVHVAQRAAIAYLAIAIADVAFQRWRNERNLRMDKQSVKEEAKQQELPSEVKAAQRRRALELARRRMMDAVPSADVVVTNPTHYAVALRYDPARPAPVVVAKGADHLAAKIRAAARAAGVPIVPDPPLARSLHAAVEIGQLIPEELYHAVAQLLAYVFRVAGRKVAA